MEHTIRIIGNAPSASEGISRSFTGSYIGLNAALIAFEEKGVNCDVSWVQDWRFFIEKRAALLNAGAKLDQTDFYIVDYVNLAGLMPRSAYRVRSLGREGFSFDTDRGIFEGHSSAYGALQLALRFKPKRIELFGVDYSYGLRKSRFYQNGLGWDLDLHIHDKQIREMADARRLVEKHLSIEVVFGTNSYVDSFFC